MEGWGCADVGSIGRRRRRRGGVKRVGKHEGATHTLTHKQHTHTLRDKEGARVCCGEMDENEREEGPKGM